jgi:type II secretion system protein J
MNKLRIFKSEIGLTLIEVMVVVAILALIASTIFTVFQGSLLSERRGTNKALVYSEARAALDMMSREIEQAMVDERIPIECWGRDGGGDDSDTFLFIAPLNSDNTYDDMEDLCEVGYWMNNGELIRKYETGSIDFDLSTHNNFNTVIENVFDLQFNYFDGQQWTPNGWWDELAVYGAGFPPDPVDVLPKAIKITLVMQYEPEREEIRYATFITIVNIPGTGQ